MNAKEIIKRGINAIGWDLVRTGDQPWLKFGGYIPFEAARDAAARDGIDIGDWIDKHYSHPGATAEAVQAMRTAGALDHRGGTVCEIGAGSGRYLRRVSSICMPRRYEVYETATKWRAHLARTYPSVIAHEVDGKTLAHTQDRSVDLVHAHKVFAGLTTLVAISYMREMARVVVPGGFVVFDALTESTFENGGFEAWSMPGKSYDTFPTMMPRQFLIETMEHGGCKLVSTYEVTIEPTKGTGFVFRKSA